MHHLSVLALAMACLAGAVSASGDHGSPEYVALYSLGVAGTYTLELGREGDEDEASVEFMVVPSSSADQEGLEEAEEASAAGELHPVESAKRFEVSYIPFDCIDLHSSFSCL